MFTLIQPSTPATNSPWDRVVPIIQNRHHTDVYLTDGIEEPCEYNELYHILRNAEKGDTIDFHINTPGGIIDSAFMIINAMKNSKAKVTAYLSGTVASAGTIIALAADNLVVADHTSFMIHNYSSGGHGKGAELKARQEFIDKSLNKAFTSFYKGFLTDDEIVNVINDKDMWLDKEEVEERWGDRKAFLRTSGKVTREEA
jgi:ATP-dependent protease ClpP protease subunit